MTEEIKQAMDLIGRLMDVIKLHIPEVYYRSDLIAECDDYLKGRE